MTSRSRAALTLALGLGVLAAAGPGAQAKETVLGEGRLPGLAVDAAGTAYIAWSQDSEGGATALRFCRYPRGATACDGSAASTIPRTDASLAKAVPYVSGSRVVIVQPRFATDLSGFSAVYAFTSTDRGATFGPGKVIGSVAVFDTVAGPGDTVSGVEENGKDLQFQNMPLDGSAPVNPDGTSAVPSAALAGGAQAFNATVGLLDAATPMVVFQRGEGGSNAAFRRYDGSGSVNDVANWTPPADIGAVYAPVLAGGPNGLFLLGRDANVLQDGDLFVRKFNGTTFGPPVKIDTSAGGVRVQDLFQDAAGRLHAVYERATTDTVSLVHAVSDDGVSWRKGTLVSLPAATTGAIVNPFVGTAADHIGLAVAESATDPSMIAVAPVGPDAPGASSSLPEPSVSSQGSAKRKGNKVRFKVSGKLILPAGVPAATGCAGKVTVTLRRGKKAIASKTATVGKTCAYKVSGRVKRAKVKKASSLGVRLAFGGNAVLAPHSEKSSIKLK